MYIFNLQYCLLSFLLYVKQYAYLIVATYPHCIAFLIQLSEIKSSFS